MMYSTLGYVVSPELMLRDDQQGFAIDGEEFGMETIVLPYSSVFWVDKANPNTPRHIVG